MNTKNDFYFHLYPNDFNEISPLSEGLNNITCAYIICKYSFKNNPNFDIAKFIHNFLSLDDIRQIDKIKTDFSFNEIMLLKNNNVDFYVVSKERLSKMCLGIKIKCNSNIHFFEKQGKNILYFPNEFKFISFKVKNISNLDIISQNDIFQIFKNKNNHSSFEGNLRLKVSPTKNNQNEKNEINKLKKEIDSLKSENEKLKDELSKANKIISRLQNNQVEANEKNKLLTEENQNLKYQLNLQFEEISLMKFNIDKKNTEKVNINDVIVVNFVSVDSVIHCGIKCLQNETFAVVEEKLYKRYDNYRNTNNTFIANAKPVLRFKTILENGIKDGDNIQLYIIE